MSPPWETHYIISKGVSVFTETPFLFRHSHDGSKHFDTIKEIFQFDIFIFRVLIIIMVRKVGSNTGVSLVTV